MPTTTEYNTIASSFLRQANAPDTKENRAAITAWLRQESGGNIIGNNPWNIHYDAALSYGIQPSGKWWSNGDKAYVASFASLDDGMAATVKFLDRDVHGYRAAITALRRGDSIGFLNAIAASDWAAGHYGAQVDTTRHVITGGTNKLIAIYRMVLAQPGGGNPTITDPNTTGPTEQPTNGNQLPAWGGLVRFNVGHKLTDADITSIMAILEKGGFFADIFGGPVARADTEKILRGHIGDAWTPELLKTMQGEFFNTAAKAGDPLGEIAPHLFDIPKFLLDPFNWLATLTLFVGVGLVGYGLVVLIRGYSAGPTVAVIERETAKV